ncbi:alpha-1,2-fucosyltransferase [Hymenobacter elongatus]|uniref:Alpha-1,2-fucosyltransferase n=1 Tax=Hymenobacter elongatus TaxID=877208 RepID=A0A4Z0PG00_9BACT|nr:alpha-1,2-fucosyltransferase [Hymenobacter elongatus]TGE14041.1 hypothetical protein E5J99_17825 [Hymenobacter elongatus]
MVILTKDFDGFGNHLLLTSHFIANTAEHNYELLIPSFGPYAPFFEGTARDDFEGLPVRLRAAPADVTSLLYQALQSRWGFGILNRLPWLQRRLGLRIQGDENDRNKDLNDPAYLTEARNGCLLIHGWLFRDKTNFVRHSDLLRRIFRPIAPHQQAIEQVVARNRQAADVLVGVHIRRGDYAGWYGGAYLYKNATYVRAMREMKALFPAHVRVRFLLFSNEPISDTEFAEFDTGRSTNHPVEDLYAMAGCDYIIGPLSTYSMWASFYGRVPLFHLHRPDQAVTALEDFTVFEDQKTEQWQSDLVV